MGRASPAATCPHSGDERGLRPPDEPAQDLDGVALAGAEGGERREGAREGGCKAETLHAGYASIHHMNRWTSCFFWSFYLTPQAVERI